MDLSTVIGMVLGIGLVLGAMSLGGSIGMFVDAASIAIVVGGTIATCMTQETLPNVLSVMKTFMQAIFDKTVSVEITVQKLLSLADIARRNGVLALEKEEVPTPFMKKAQQLLCDGMAAEELRSTLEGELSAMKDRHERAAGFFKFASASAPAMGMIGTLVGLVQMLQKLDNPAAIGPAMAVALLTTLYGALIAFLICGPIAEKLDKRSKDERLTMILTLEGFTCIARGDNPSMVKEKLLAFLAPAKREAAGNTEKSGG